MTWPKRYDPQTTELELSHQWEQSGIYQFDANRDAPVYSIDTPPPSISGHLHLGHVYSYSHTDFTARYRRMRGDNVFYPMGFDDNGLPTERLVERRLGVKAAEVGREAFIRTCLEASKEFADEYRVLWQRLGLSVDWRYSYDTIDKTSRRTAQLSFIDLYRKGLAYESEAPVIWCPECRTAIAQAEVEDLQRESEFVTLGFRRHDGRILPIATTRPELLSACVAVFVHPNDERYQEIVGEYVETPLFRQSVPVIADDRAQPEKGTGAVMCCTFGDTTDIEWWHVHHLSLRAVIDKEGRLTEQAGALAGESVSQARRHAVDLLSEQGSILQRRPIEQTVGVHERCGTPVEYIVTRQWFVRLLEHKDDLLQAGESVQWYPEHMKARYREWIENLRWDWLISRQRYYGVPFPVWHCSCGEVLLADETQLPVDPGTDSPPQRCGCGSESYKPELDVMDTWATSSLSPQIVGRRLTDPELYSRVFPMSLRPQAHDIIRTWAFYTVVQSLFHFGQIPWADVVISGWGVAPQGQGKISKSKGSGPIAPMETLERYSADAARYWAASTGPGKDSVISEEKIQAGAKLVTKLWNVAGFSRRFLEGSRPSPQPQLSPADRWILHALTRVVERATLAFEQYDYTAAKNETEVFFWRDLSDNYLEMAKRRLYDPSATGHEAARFTLHTVVLTTLKLFAPILPFITDQIFQLQFRESEGAPSIHRSAWPAPESDFIDEQAGDIGQVLLEIATSVRRYKSSQALSLGSELQCLEIWLEDAPLKSILQDAADDIMSVTRAREILFPLSPSAGAHLLPIDGQLTIGVRR